MATPPRRLRDDRGAGRTGGAPATVFVGLGANLGAAAETLAAALDAMRATPGISRVVASPVYRTAPVGGVPQDDFLNAVARLETDLRPLPLLDTLQAIERRFGRERFVRWGPRTLDLDILFYGDRVIRHPRLTVPHPELHRRGFVLVPLADLAPGWRHPVIDETVARLRDDWYDNAPAPEFAVRRAGLVLDDGRANDDGRAIDGGVTNDGAAETDRGPRDDA